MTQEEFDKMAEEIKWEKEQETEALIQFLYKKIKPTGNIL